MSESKADKFYVLDVEIPVDDVIWDSEEAKQEFLAWLEEDGQGE